MLLRLGCDGGAFVVRLGGAVVLRASAFAEAKTLNLKLTSTPHAKRDIFAQPKAPRQRFCRNYGFRR